MNIVYAQSTGWIHVIIPVYNCMSYLAQSVNSVLAQPFKNIDILLVDDGSTDGSSVLCDQLASNHTAIHVIHQKNAGASAARNAALDYVLATANIEHDYVAFLDADDIWLPNAITSEVMQNIHGIDMCGFGMLGSNQTMDRFRVNASYINETIADPVSLVWDWNLFFCCYLYSCNLLTKYSPRFTQKTKYGEDRMFVIQCLYFAQSACHINRFLYLYRYNEVSMMHRKNRLSPIDYFTQIITGWIATDKEINRWTSVTGHVSRVGATLASIYCVEMAASHYQSWKNPKALESVLRDDPYHSLTQSIREKDVSPKQYTEYRLWKRHHQLFRLKHTILGVPAWFKRLLFNHIPLVKELYIKRQYPLLKIPENDKI